MDDGRNVSRASGAWLRVGVTNVAVAAAYFAVAVATVQFYTAFHPFDAPVWPAAGVALAAVLLSGAATAPGIFLGSVVANFMLYAASPVEVLLLSLTNTVGPLVGGLLVRRWYPPRQPVLLLGEMRRFLWFGILLSAVISAAGGATAATYFGEDDRHWLTVFSEWLIADGAGMLLVAAPAMLTWIDRRKIETRHWPRIAIVAAVVLVIGLSRLVLPPGFDLPTGVPVIVAIAATWLLAPLYPRDAAVILAIVVVAIVIGVTFDSPPEALANPEIATRFVGLGVSLGMVNVLLIGAMVEERAQAMRQISEDVTTGLPNRGAFLDIASREVERAHRFGRPLSMCSFDIDGFRSINARHGSVVGDAVLTSVAGHARAWLRPLDVLARIGDDEFAILMVETDPESATRIAEQLRITIASTPIEIGGAVIAVTVSVGVTGARPGEPIDAVFDRALASRHMAAVAGRNRVAAA